jgi:hypothetical protein
VNETLKLLISVLAPLVIAFVGHYLTLYRTRKEAKARRIGDLLSQMQVVCDDAAKEAKIGLTASATAAESAARDAVALTKRAATLHVSLGALLKQHDHNCLFEELLRWKSALTSEIPRGRAKAFKHDAVPVRAIDAAATSLHSSIESLKTTYCVGQF